MTLSKKEHDKLVASERIADTTQANTLKKQGWKLDGPLGYVWTKA